MKRAYAYMRCSGLGQVDGDTWDRQTEAIKKFCLLHGIEVAGWYREEGVTGTTENRETFAQMMADMEENSITIVLIEKLDRLARDVIVQENLIRYLQNRRVEILSTSPAEVGLCENDPTRKFIRVVLGATAQLEKDLIILRTRAARDRIRSRGERCEGRKPFGMKDGESDTLVQMTAWRFVNRWTFDKIASTLNAKKIPSRTGSIWHPSTVQRIIERGV